MMVITGLRNRVLQIGDVDSSSQPWREEIRRKKRKSEAMALGQDTYDQDLI